MKNKYKFNVRHGLVLTIAVLSLASINGLALTIAPSAKSAISGARTIATVAKAASINTPSVMTEDIRDIRGAKHIPSRWLWPLWLAGGVAFAALLYAAWLWRRRHVLADALLPYEIALALLEKARVLIQPESAREFSIAVSEIVRQYIEARFQVLAARRTTEEFLHDLLEPSDALLASHRELLASFLRQCDLAKFARWILSREEMETMLERAHDFVLGTGKPMTAEAVVATRPSIPESLNTASHPVHANS